MLNRCSLRGVVLVLGVAVGTSLLWAARTIGQAWQGGDGQSNDGPPVYQQHPVNGHPTDGHGFDHHRRDERRDRRDLRRDFRRDSRFVSPRVTAGWFQRPYPYHLDYYKMRYGGSYAPYFGNLYGTPAVVNYPPYYGPYYGGYDGGYANGYGPPGYGGAAAYPFNPGAMLPGTEADDSGSGEAQAGGPPAKVSGDILPAPTPTP